MEEFLDPILDILNDLDLTNVALALVILVMVVIPLGKRLWNWLKTTKKVEEIKKDLMVWRNLAGLAKGGEDADRAKEGFANRSEDVKADFRQGYTLLAQNSHVAANLPWFLLVGEPAAGKTALLERSDLELTPSADPAPGDQAALRFWLGGRAIVLDFAGRLFFDRWMGGSSAEMRTLEKLIARHNRAKPLSGIILAIPADALLGDERPLARRKAMLIAAELESLTARLGMVLPVHVVVTKLDRVAGFGDFMSELDDSMRHQSFGWQPSHTGPGFDEADFGNFWTRTVERLREAVPGLMRTTSVVGRVGSSRLEKTAGIYLFPESFSELRDGLETYLRTIFGGGDFVGVKSVELAGVSFTSAMQTGPAFSRDLAATAGRSVDDTAVEQLPTGERGEGRPFFITNLLGQWIFQLTDSARFTRRAALKRRLPVHALCVAMLALAGWWLYAAWFETEPFKDELVDDAQYYTMLSDTFRDGRITHAPLLTLSPQSGPGTVFDRPFPGGSSMSRLDFFRTAYSETSRPIYAPWGLKASSLLQFGISGDLERRSRRFLFDQVQTHMSFLPALTLLERDFNLAGSSSGPFTHDKRDAVFALLSFADYRSKVGWTDRQQNPLYSKSSLAAFLDYLYPEMPDSTIGILSSFHPESDRMADRLNATIVLSNDYESASRAGVSMLLSSFSAGTAFPSTLWQRVNVAAEAAETIAKSAADARRLAAVKDPVAIDEAVARWRDIAARTASANALITPELKEAMSLGVSGAAVQTPGQKLFDLATKNVPGADKVMEKAGDAARRMIAANPNARLDRAFAEYRSELMDDLSLLEQHLVSTQHDAALHTDRHAFTREAITSTRTTVERRLSDQRAALTTRVEAIRGNALFQPVRETNQEGSAAVPLGVDLFTEFMRLTAVPDLTETRGGVEGFRARWTALTRGLAERRAAFRSFLDANKDVKLITELAPLGEAMITAAADEARLAAVAALMDAYPDASSSSGGAAGLSARIGRAAASEDETGFSEITAGEVLHGFAVRKEYRLEAARLWLEPVGLIADALQPAPAAADAEEGAAKTAPVAGFAETLSADRRWKRVYASASIYAREFVRWWGAAGDGVKPRAGSWVEFLDFAKTSEAWRINAALLSVYDHAAEALGMVPASLLSGVADRERTGYLERINSRRKDLTVGFNDACAAFLSAWTALPEDPLEANRLVTRMKPSDRAKLSISSVETATESKTAPWWREFDALGLSLMKGGAARRVTDEFASTQLSPARFPLMKDAPANEAVLTRADIARISTALTDFGISAKPADGAADPVAGALASIAALASGAGGGNDAMAAPLDFNVSASSRPALTEWAKDVQNISSLLLERDVPLSWQLLLPTVAEHEALVKALAPGEASALGRFRYLEVSKPGAKTGARIPTANSAAQPRVLSTGRVSDAGFTLRLMRFSDEEGAESDVTVTGGWAMLRIWLMPGARYDKEAGVVWAPFRVVDRLCAESVIVLGVKPSRELPSPEEWPDSAHWPAF